MTAAEEGVLLLCSRLGDPDSKPLTVPQFRELGSRVRAAAMDGDPLRQLRAADLQALGYDEMQTARILRLLDREATLHRYLQQAKELQILPLTRTSPDYPQRIREKLGFSCPPVLFYRGDLSLLRKPSLAVVGSRRLLPENEAFARDAGRFAAEQQLMLVSGGAIGADLTAQNACLSYGGGCVIFPADRLDRCRPHERVLYLSADGYDSPFSAPRALLRNNLIHTQGDRVIAAQCTYGSGGTWQGCLENLRHGWSDLFVYDDHSKGAAALMERGATAITTASAWSDLKPDQLSLF